MSQSLSFEGKKVLVLGASGQLGRRISGLLADRGASLALAGRDPARLSEVAAALGLEGNTLVHDLNGPQPGAIVDRAVVMLGGLDGVVDAAGVVAFGPTSEVSAAALSEVMNVNLVAPLEVFRAAIREMTEDGFLVAITGVVAEQPVANLAAYSSAKSGLSSALKAMARELRRMGIHVLDARPPHTETGLAGRSIEGVPPPFPQGLDPDMVAGQIVDGLAAGRREIPSTDFK